MKKIRIFISFIILFTFSYACQPIAPPKIPNLDPPQLRALQDIKIPADLETCFKASIFVLQNDGWVIKVSDKTNGLIQAESLRHRSGYSPELDYLKEKHGYPELKVDSYVILDNRVHVRYGRQWDRWKEANLALESWGKDSTRVRISVVKKAFLPAKTETASACCLIPFYYHKPEENRMEIDDDPKVYQDFFAQLKGEISRRQKLQKENVSRP